MAVKAKESDGKKGKKSRRKKKNFGRILRFVIFALLVVGIVFGIIHLSGFGVSHRSAKGVVTSLIKAYGKGNEKQVKDCYGQSKDTEPTLQKEIDASFSFFSAHGIKGIDVGKCEVMSDYGMNAYVYVLYKLILENGQEYPCLSTYMTKRLGQSYYVMAASEITDQLQSQAVLEYQKFMMTDTYKNYTTDYNTFIKKNPGYEDRIAGKLAISTQMEDGVAAGE